MKRILVVDDDPGMRSVVSDALRQDGFDVHCVCNGRQALSAFGRHRPDVMVLDLEMPVMDGPTLVRALREQTRWGRVPVVVISGARDASATCQRMGARACLNKPFELLDLLDAVEQISVPAES